MISQRFSLSLFHVISVGGVKQKRNIEAENLEMFFFQRSVGRIHHLLSITHLSHEIEDGDGSSAKCDCDRDPAISADRHIF